MPELLASQLDMTEEMIGYFFEWQSRLARDKADLSNLWFSWWQGSESMLFSWTDTHRQLTDSWLQILSMKGPLHSELGPAPEASPNVLEHWRDAAIKVLDVQDEWFQLCADSLFGQEEGTPGRAMLGQEGGEEAKRLLPQPAKVEAPPPALFTMSSSRRTSIPVDKVA